jgi:RNA polymerase sigma factor (TIGR02999 family)
MPSPFSVGVSRLLAGGEELLEEEQRTDLNEIFSLVYEELKRLASYIRRGQPGATLNTTALVHEAWLKLQKSVSLEFESEAHFKAIAAKAMRQILVDAARRREARKRGGAGEAILVTLDASVGIKPTCDAEIIALEAALHKLEEMDPRQAKVVECRFFGSMTVEQTAGVLCVSASVVERDWRAAKAWLGSVLAPKELA